MKLWMKIFIGMILGVITGMIIGPSAEYLKPIGTIFLSLINMIIVPLVLSSMAVGITSIHDPKKLGRVGLRTLVMYLATTLVAILFGLLFVNLFDVGHGLQLQVSAATAAKPIEAASTPSLGSILLSIIPSNPVAAMVKGDIIQIIIFALFLGMAINFAGAKGEPLKNFFASLADVMYRLTSLVMEFAPIGVFAIMAWVAGTFGLTVLIPLLKFLLVFYVASFVHVIIVFCGILRFMAKVSVLPFFRGMGSGRRS